MLESTVTSTEIILGGPDLVRLDSQKHSILLCKRDSKHERNSTRERFCMAVCEVCTEPNHMTRNAGGLWGLSTAPWGKPARRWGPDSYNHKELNDWSLEKDFELKKRTGQHLNYSLMRSAQKTLICYAGIMTYTTVSSDLRLLSSHYICGNFLKIFIYLFIYLAVLGLSCSTWDL